MKNAVFLSPAEDEMLAAALYYENEVQGLGADFLSAVDAAVAGIRRNPELWPAVRKNTRRHLVTRFPFGILYVNTELEIRIIAVMHLKRDPDFWNDRV